MMSRDKRREEPQEQYNIMSEQLISSKGSLERSSSPNLSCNSEEWITAMIHIPGIKELSFLPHGNLPKVTKCT